MPALLFESVDVDKAIAEEKALSPGLYEIRLATISPLNDAEIAWLKNHLITQVVDVKSVNQRLKGLWQVGITYQKHAPSERVGFLPAVIPLIPLALMATVVGIALFKVADIIRSVAPVVFIVVGGLLLLALIARKPAEKYIEKRL